LTFRFAEKTSWSWKSIVRWFVVKEKYCSFAEKVRLIRQANRAWLQKKKKKRSYSTASYSPRDQHFASSFRTHRPDHWGLWYSTDAKVILAIPLTSDQENTLAWHYDQRGLFSVRSAYKVCRRGIANRQRRNGGTSSLGSANKQDDLWSSLWKMEIPNKVKNTSYGG
jgi:hypothetical protein